MAKNLIRQGEYTKKDSNYLKDVLEMSNRGFIEFLKNYLKSLQNSNAVALNVVSSIEKTISNTYFPKEIDTYSSDDLFSYLINLCQKHDVTTLNKYKETFKTIFTKEDSQELHK